MQMRDRDGQFRVASLRDLWREEAVCASAAPPGDEEPERREECHKPGQRRSTG